MRKSKEIVDRMDELGILKPFTENIIRPRTDLQFQAIVYATMDVEVPFSNYDKLFSEMVLLDIRPISDQPITLESGRKMHIWKVRLDVIGNSDDYHDLLWKMVGLID